MSNDVKYANYYRVQGLPSSSGCSNMHWTYGWEDAQGDHVEAYCLLDYVQHGDGSAISTSVATSSMAYDKTKLNGSRTELDSLRHTPRRTSPNYSDLCVWAKEYDILAIDSYRKCALRMELWLQLMSKH